ncbi:FERM domain-containing protein 7 [Latimeria chalumnae]|uniref:FERM domain-containing protein 7 n=1 Tax=Latimeria chalumnae TaxID=7897 RepID=UPI00313E70AB
MCERQTRSPLPCKSGASMEEAPASSSRAKMLHLKVHFLDDTEEVFAVEQRMTGNDFFNMICTYLNLVEKEYFGLEFRNHHGNNVWLESLKPVAKQMKNPKEVQFRFMVKFFPLDPEQMQYELTRYLFGLQIKQDLAMGCLPCSDNSAALMVSYILQSELGDFIEERDRQHLEHNQYLPNQEYLDNKIMRFHQKHTGRSPAESDIQLLCVVRKLEMYGIRPHPATDGEGMKINLAVTHMGVLVFQASCKDTLEFTMASRDACKSFWKTCVEYHAFFRLSEEPKSKQKSFLYSKGSSFRYSGRTQKQLLGSTGKGQMKNLPFKRKHCKVQYNTRQCRSSPDLLTDVSKQVNELRLPYNMKVYYKELSEKLSQRSLEANRRNSAVEVVFAAELERSKPEADPASIQQSKISSSFPHICYRDAENKPDVLQGPKSTIYSETSKIAAVENKNRMLGIQGDVARQYPRQTGSPNKSFGVPLLDSVVPNVSFYLGKPPQVPRRTSVLVEEILRMSSCSSSVSLSPTGKELNNLRGDGPYETAAARDNCGSISSEVQESGRLCNAQTQTPQRSWSQSDMKLLRAAHGSEFRPIGPCPPLIRKSSIGRYVLPQQIAKEHKGAWRATERFVSSGTESSDSDSEIINPYYYPLFGKIVRNSSLARIRLSSGSLQFDEEDEDSFDLCDSEDMSSLTASNYCLEDKGAEKISIEL